METAPKNCVHIKCYFIKVSKTFIISLDEKREENCIFNSIGFISLSQIPFTESQNELYLLRLIFCGACLFFIPN